MRHFRSGLIVAAAGVATATGLIVGSLVAFADRFREGATLSGLNPGGGGPGFLLLLSAAAAGIGVVLISARAWDRLGLAGVTAAACAAGLAISVGVVGFAGVLLPPSMPSVVPLAVSSGMAFAVGAVVTERVRQASPSSVSDAD